MRWSFVRLILGMKHLLKEWQVGDGREQAVLEHVIATAPAGNVDAAIAAIDDFAYKQSFLINVGDEKGKILDGVLERAKPMRVLELGAYVGYSALRIARKLPPGGHLYTIEFNESNAGITRRMLAHAGVADRVTVVHGSLGDGGKTLAALTSEHGFAAGNLDVVFIDHDKEMYVPDAEARLAYRLLNASDPRKPERQRGRNRQLGDQQADDRCGRSAMRRHREHAGQTASEDHSAFSIASANVSTSTV
jgi:catechol O-methyltransferase